MADIERALRIDPDYAVAVTTRGEIYEVLGRKDEAIADFKRATAIDPSLEDPKLGLRRLDPGYVAPVTGSVSSSVAVRGPTAKMCSRFIPSAGMTIPVACDP
jgi:tetratricopeptide (TPR) repeat protein